MQATKWALVTGASSGIGRSVALYLAEAGYSLLLVARRGELLEQVRDQIQSQNQKIQIQCYVLDVQNKEEVEIFFKTQESFLSKIGVLVNNAGLARGMDKVQEGNISDWEEMIDTNIKGVLYMTHGILKYMCAQKRGDIINIGSVAGRWVYPGGAVYCGTKSFVNSLTEGLRMDLVGTGIRVMNIEPGKVQTEFSNVRFKGDSVRAQKVYEGMTALSAEDIAETVIWCIQRPHHVNIQEVVIYPTEQAGVR